MSPITLLATGDISLISDEDTNPFEKIVSQLSDVDIRLGNLETALTKKKPEVEKATALVVSPQRARWLQEAGFTVVSIANNHITDAGSDGFLTTVQTLSKLNIHTCGGSCVGYEDDYYIKQIKGMKVVFLAYYQYGYSINKHNISINRLEPESILSDINSHSDDNTFVIVSLHWGIENTYFPSPAQIKLARAIIDTGASVVIGHHPHVAQGVESYNNGIIAYSLGNCQFPAGFDGLNQKRMIMTDTSFLLKVSLEKGKPVTYQTIPVKINKQNCPEPMSYEKAQLYNEYLEKLSQPIIENSYTTGDWFEHIAEEYVVSNKLSFMRRIKKHGGKHLRQYIRWRLSPFMWRCYGGQIRSSLKKIIGRRTRLIGGDDAFS